MEKIEYKENDCLISKNPHKLEIIKLGELFLNNSPPAFKIKFGVYLNNTNNAFEISNDSYYVYLEELKNFTKVSDEAFEEIKKKAIALRKCLNSYNNKFFNYLTNCVNKKLSHD